jgi:hypothetical protein
MQRVTLNKEIPCNDKEYVETSHYGPLGSSVADGPSAERGRETAQAYTHYNTAHSKGGGAHSSAHGRIWLGDYIEQIVKTVNDGRKAAIHVSDE